MIEFEALNYPKTELQLYKIDDEVFVWDVFRKRRLLLTPEEWVRQHVLHFLVKQRNVPIGLIASEYLIRVNDLDRRCDGVVFDKSGEPIMIIECKATSVKISEETFQQIAQYNFKLRVEWLVMTNGIQTVVANVSQKHGDIRYFADIPPYKELMKEE